MYHENPTDYPAVAEATEAKVKVIDLPTDNAEKAAQGVLADISGLTKSQGSAVGATPGASLSPALEEEVAAIDQRLQALEGEQADDLDADIARYGKKAQAKARIAVTAAYYAIIYAWTTGRLFNLGKDVLPRGQFGQWRDAKAGELGISVKTAQHWMKLAKGCWNIRALLVPGASLTSAYRAVGVLPKPSTAVSLDESGDGGGDDGGGATPPPGASSALEQTFTTLTKGRMRLRHQLESGESLSGADRDRLEGEKAAYIELFDKLLQTQTQTQNQNQNHE